MKQLYPIMENILNMINERKELSSSFQSESTCIVILEFLKHKFEHFTKQDIIINSKEYYDLLYIKRNILIDNKVNYTLKEIQEGCIINTRKIDKEINEIEEKMEYLQSLIIL